MTRTYLLLALAALLAFSGCIRDEIPACPPLQVKITVRDKNYFNIDAAAKWGLDEKKPLDLPFRDYVSTLYYILHDAETGEVVREQHLWQVTSGDSEIPVSFPDDMPFGTYVLTVWGNMRSEVPLGDNPTTSDLHLYNAEGNDIYTSHDTLVYTEQDYEYTVELERVKGKLIVTGENLPDQINYSTKLVDHLYSFVTANFNYLQETEIYTDTLWQKPNNILTHTLACPSTGTDYSRLDVNFYKLGPKVENEVNWIAPEDVHITMARNTLTIIRFIYEKGGGSEPWVPIDPPDPPDPPQPPIDPPGPDNPDGNSKFRMYILVNDNWENLHSMEIE